ncbi:MAG: hypothetical protein K6B28_09155 [Lachnospiraceae bacterium]|nr:hypothetical protein [Lachnospiraceae bacterium]
MNGKDLMDSLSGIDPKYIDEAAYELKDNQTFGKSSNKLRMKKSLFIALPTAAAILLAILVSFPAIRRLNNSEASSADAYKDSEAAAESPEVYESAEPAYEETDTDSEAAAESAEAYVSAEPAYEETDTGSEAAAESAEAYVSAEPAYEETDMGSEATAESAYESEEYLPSEAADSHTSDGVYEADKQASMKEASEEAIPSGDANEMSEAMAAAESKSSYDTAFSNGILTIEYAGNLPSDIEDSEYTITGKDENGQDKLYGKGVLKDIIRQTDPLMLDLTDHELTAGSYTLSFADEVIKFSF